MRWGFFFTPATVSTFQRWRNGSINDTIEADEAALKTGTKSLIQLFGNALAEIFDLKSAPAIDPTIQARLTALHTNLTSDLNDVTATLTADGSAIPVPAAAVIPDTGGATGGTPDTSTSGLTA